MQAGPSSQEIPASLPEVIPAPVESGITSLDPPRPSPRCLGDINPALPAVASASAPCNVGRMSSDHQPVCSTATNSVNLSVVLSDVAEEDTDIEDAGHISPVIEVQRNIH